MTLESLNEVKTELARFQKKLAAAIARMKSDDMVRYTGCKETGAVKRAALDLKGELTKITR